MTNPTKLIWTSEKILHYLEQHAEQLKAMGVVKLGLFGSYAKQQQNQDSDMDFIVEMRTPSYRDFMTVWHFLEDSFGVSVDLGEVHLIRDEIRQQVLEDVIYVKGL